MHLYVISHVEIELQSARITRALTQPPCRISHPSSKSNHNIRLDDKSARCVHQKASFNIALMKFTHSFPIFSKKYGPIRKMMRIEFIPLVISYQMVIVSEFFVNILRKSVELVYHNRELCTKQIKLFVSLFYIRLYFLRKLEKNERTP